MGHNYKSVVTAPTCTASGYTTYTCSGCGHTYKSGATAALGHKFAGGSCTVAGKCTVCGASETSVPGHSYDKGVVTAPTCTASGYTTYTCGTCGYSYVGNKVAALGHSWKNATCEEAEYCSTCGEVQGTALGHTAGEPEETVVIEPDCTVEGLKEITVSCTVCG